MKKILSIILAATLVLAAFVSLTVPAAANDAVLDEYEGSWDVMLSATAQPDDPKNPPLAGYYYDATGFHTDAPDYTNYNPKFSVVSKEMYNIQNFSMTIVVHDYSIVGDNWLSFSVWSESNGFAQGDTSGKYGDGWTSMIRSGADGNVNRFESWDMRKGGRSGKQTFTAIDNTQLAPIVFDPIVDAETGDFTVTFKIENGVVTVNGSVIGAGTDSCIADRFKDGLAYVGVTLHNTDSRGGYSPSISIVDVNGMTPEGSDYRAPADKCIVVTPIIPSETVPENQPAIWFDGTLEATNNKLPQGTNCDIDFADDNEGILVTPKESVFFMRFDVPEHLAYVAEDFPCVVVIFKNFCTCVSDKNQNLNNVCRGSETAYMWYCAGSVTAPGYDCGAVISEWYNVTPTDKNGNYLTDDMYTMAVVPIYNELWQGRIHGIRIDVSQYKYYENGDSFEIMGAGIFRNNYHQITTFVRDFRDLGLNNENFYYCSCLEPCEHLDYDYDGICNLCYENIFLTEETTDWNSSYDTNFEDGSVVETVKPEEPSEKTTEENPTVSETVEEATIEESSEKRTSRETEKEDSDEAEETKKPSDDDDIYDGDALIVFSGCESAASIGVIGVISIIGAALVIKKKED